LWIDEVLDFKQMVVWDKGPIGMGWHYRRSYETVLVASKPGAACRWFDESSKIENIIRPGYKGIRKIIPQETDHPTPKPVELARHFIELHTKEGDTVLDPFCGHAWVGVACIQLGRNFIGFESDPAHVERARKRCKAAEVGETEKLFAF
jgi:DNA modification methylase